ncbi:hypothetical protein ACMGDM_01705 [Sphingomonas sp. DT-51]|uniref:hypothetical protein n=1 Tax=Sphingomonas sp. DT-51 TaxID=3396165 RepID=UPI003F1CADF6
MNEVSQLRAEDVQEVEGVWALRITPEAGTVKTKTACLVPLHSHIIEQGFLDAVKAKGPGPLFYDPTKTRMQADGNRHFKKVGEKLAQWVREEVGISDPDLQPNHAWRHLFKFMSYDLGIESAWPMRSKDMLQPRPHGAMADRRRSRPRRRRSAVSRASWAAPRAEPSPPPPVLKDVTSLIELQALHARSTCRHPRPSHSTDGA